MNIKLKTGYYLAVRGAYKHGKDILFSGLVLRKHTISLEEWFSFDCFEPDTHNLSCAWYTGPICNEAPPATEKVATKKTSKALKNLMLKFTK